MKIVIISDTHERHDKITLPEGDMLIHCGDFTFQGVSYKVQDFANWMKSQNFKHKICIAGNHELTFQSAQKNKVIKMIEDAGITFLMDSAVEIEDLHFYGSSWTPFFFNWAFNLPRGEQLANKWKLIPEETDVLITHGPPYKILDLTTDSGSQGCEALADRVKQLPNLKLHCFGHLHHNGGQMTEIKGVKFVNAAICTDAYTPTNPPMVIEL
jgi:Icc-related predicted phosphoesterase